MPDETTKLDHATLRAVDKMYERVGYQHTEPGTTRGELRSLCPEAFAPRRVQVVRKVDYLGSWRVEVGTPGAPGIHLYHKEKCATTWPRPTLTRGPDDA